MMDRLKSLLIDVRFLVYFAITEVADAVRARPVPIAVVGILSLAVIQVLTGTAIIGPSSQKAVENVCELLLLVGLGDTLHKDVERLPHEGGSTR